MRNEKFLRLFECSDRLFAAHAREVVEEIGKRMIVLDVVEQSLQRRSRTHEHRSATENLRVGVDDLICHRHDHGIIPDVRASFDRMRNLTSAELRICSRRDRGIVPI